MASTDSRSPASTSTANPLLRLEALERRCARLARVVGVLAGILGTGLLILACALLAWSRSPDRIETAGLMLHSEPGQRPQRFHLAVGKSGLPIWWWLDTASGKFVAVPAFPPDIVAAFGQGESATSR